MVHIQTQKIHCSHLQHLLHIPRLSVGHYTVKIQALVLTQQGKGLRVLIQIGLTIQMLDRVLLTDLESKNQVHLDFL